MLRRLFFSESDPCQGKLQKNLAFCTHPDVRGFKGQTRYIYMRKGLKVTYGNYACF